MKILDTTLRDGSYVIDFKFDFETTYNLAKSLDNAGFPYIETGHGLGLGATEKLEMKGACTDEQWLEATASAVKKNKWGMFFIPGIGNKLHIDLACKYGMNFIRVGANVNEYHRAEEFIRYAKDKGLFVFANYMKTYGLGYEEVGRIAGLTSEWVVDLNCIVDSAGCMLTDDIDGYVNAIRNNTDVQIGFHGHNNLGMANILSLRAAELGVDVIDTSLRGMGRSAGNTVTEIFLLTLKRKSIDLGYDIFELMDIAEKYIDPLMKGYTQVDSYSILSGYSKFHSSFTPRLEKISQKYNVDMRKLIVAICKENIIDAPEDSLERIAKKMLKAQ